MYNTKLSYWLHFEINWILSQTRHTYTKAQHIRQFIWYFIDFLTVVSVVIISYFCIYRSEHTHINPLLFRFLFSSTWSPYLSQLIFVLNIYDILQNFNSLSVSFPAMGWRRNNKEVLNRQNYSWSSKILFLVTLNLQKKKEKKIMTMCQRKKGKGNKLFNLIYLLQLSPVEEMSGNGSTHKCLLQFPAHWFIFASVCMC